MSEPPSKKRALEGGKGSPVEQVTGFKNEAEKAEFMEVVGLLLGKVREGIDVWDELIEKGAQWFFDTLTGINLSKLNVGEATDVLVLLIAAYESLEKEEVRKHFLSRASVPLFMSLSKGRRELEIAGFAKLKKPLAKMEKQIAADPDAMIEERTYFPNLVASFLDRLAQCEQMLKSKKDNNMEEASIILCSRYLEFFSDLLSQMPTRRFLHAYFDDINLLTYCTTSFLYLSGASELFKGLVNLFAAVMQFPIENQTAEALTASDIETQHCTRAMVFQRVAHKNFPDKMKQASMCNLSMLDEKTQLTTFIEKLNNDELRELCGHLCIQDPDISRKVNLSRGFLTEALVLRHSKHPDHSDLNKVALYPDESVLWNTSMTPSESYTGNSPLALPKLNLQFLSIQDYLLRNFKLIQLESAYEIKEDVVDVVTRMAPAHGPGGLRYQGMHRMALPISSMQVIKVAPPPIGFTRPAHVRADVHYTLGRVARSLQNVRSEWDALRMHDVLIFVTLGRPEPNSPDERRRLGVETVRGGEVLDIRDDDGNVASGYDTGVRLVGENRHIRVALDPVAYQKDAHTDEKLYERFHLMIRRRPQENNFKAVLDTIRDLMNHPATIPDWLHDVFLGYGDADGAHYKNLENQDEDSEEEDEKEEPVIIRSPRAAEEHFLYESDIPKKHEITFSPQQAKAITTAHHPGLSLVVGPPGTGKTDVAVQIITNLYHKYPNQNTLIITHSNAALNDIFSKVMLKDVDERHLLRLGRGEKDLETNKDFSRWGRVNYMLERRQELLKRVEKLCDAVEVDTGFANTCEAAGNFFKHHVESRWERFMRDVEKSRESEKTARRVVALFPFEKYFKDASKPLWERADSFENAMATAHQAWVHLTRVFNEVADCRAFELLRTSGDRGDYLLTKQAKIIAMTCTHAALKRRDFLKLGFRYDNLIMEEAAQILEVETFIPMVLQKPLENGKSRLKRVVLIGDHNQLPPVVKNPTFQKYCKMEQSMFTRFVRLGVPTTQLDAQGRMRRQLADLFRWRYTSLSDLPHVAAPTFQKANGGFSSVFQCINVEGAKESQPQPHFYQNVKEAEFIVATYMFMRLLGYESDKITILTTYQGQKHLIKDVLNFRCKAGSYYGVHPRVSTVDKYQGQQNDFVLLSLVRTEKVGHLRDIRRLVVALSRARLGLYVFGKVELFKDVWELQRAFGELMKAPTQLAVCINEMKKGTERVAEDPGESQMIATFEQLSSTVSKMEAMVVTEDMRKAAAGKQSEQHAKPAPRQQVTSDAEKSRTFAESSTWQGERPGWYFGTGRDGLGYYLDEAGTESLQRQGK
eukprot:TRINITY_DN8313_c0_g1_i2.p1 TRINITY_DN8313_c0_g1~~TRINITY_DN8313_c0_g1_i2.p1  ORF type:complete len:1319 (+),score=327.48 TRINITY_DN8313_c0_g1_i2:52-4008(+)